MRKSVLRVPAEKIRRVTGRATALIKNTVKTARHPVNTVHRTRSGRVTAVKARMQSPPDRPKDEEQTPAPYPEPAFAGLFKDDSDLSIRVKDIARGREDLSD